MKRSTVLILSFAGAGVASAFLLADPVAGATAGSPMLAAGAESLVALGGAYYAWKKNSRAGAIVGGVAAGLLTSVVKGRLGSPPAASSTLALSAPPPVSSMAAPQIIDRHPAGPDYSGFVYTPEPPKPDFSQILLAIDKTPKVPR